MKAKLIERCTDVNELFFAGCHAGLECGPIAKFRCLAGFTDRGVLDEIEFEARIGWAHCHRSRPVTVVGDI